MTYRETGPQRDARVLKSFQKDDFAARWLNERATRREQEASAHEACGMLAVVETKRKEAAVDRYAASRLAWLADNANRLDRLSEPDREEARFGGGQGRVA